MSNIDLLNIPPEWSRTTISELCEINPKVKLEDELKVGFMPMASVPVEFHGKPEYEIKSWSEVKKGYTQFKDGDALFAKITPCFENGKACVVEDFPNGHGAGSTEFFVLRPIKQHYHPKLLLAVVKTREFLTLGATNMTGSVGHKRVPKEFVENYPIPLPPLAEQQQIATKLDELLAQVDTIKTRLDAIPKILKRFRQSVLAAAVSGKLTEDWRANMSYIQSEFGWHIPKSWQLLVIDDIAEVKGGKRLPKGESLVSENTGYPYIRAGQLKDGTVMEEDQLFLLNHVQAKISRYIVNTGDLYITIVGACIGDAGIIPPNYDGANLTENAAKLCLFKKPLNEKYLSNWLRSQYLQDIIQNEIKSGAQGKLALKRIKTLPVPYPPIEEQSEIVRRVEQFFTYADQIEQRVKDAQSRVNHITQAILAKAFRGELTAEWRDQNPDLISGENNAEALLVMIKKVSKKHTSYMIGK